MWRQWGVERRHTVEETHEKENSHVEFADEGIFWQLHMEVHLTGFVCSISNSAGDDSHGIAATHPRFDVEAVDVQVIGLKVKWFDHYLLTKCLLV